MSKNKFKNHLMKKIESAFPYAMIRSKGQELEYTNIEMQYYLRPEASMFQEKQDMFKMRSRMIYIRVNSQNT